MQAWIALIKREYLEHRGAFVIGPAILLVLMLAAAGYSALRTGFSGDFADGLPTALRFYETIFALASAGWLLYLVIMLFFYYADAFSADSRNNSMLFWKSMPQSDLKIFGTKVAASLTIFPAAILLAIAITGVIAYLPALMAGNILVGYAPPGLVETAAAWFNVMVTAIVAGALALLWYMPYFAWVGLLSTLFRRWALPLAFLIPAVAGLFEKVILRTNPLESGYIWDFVSNRFQLRFEGLDFELYWLSGAPWDGPELAVRMLTGMDWVSLTGGLAVATLFVYAASEYRRRYVLT